MHREKRLYPRHAVTCQLSGRALNPLNRREVPPPWADQELYGEVSNMSTGGLCLLTDDSPNVSDPFRCEILAPQMPVAIPVLLQVRWASISSIGRNHRLGLQFLI